MYRLLKAGFLFFLIFLIGLVLIFLTTRKVIDKDCLLLETTEQIVVIPNPLLFFPA